jgi:GNAT superfamily N-acetyltransferase
MPHYDVQVADDKDTDELLPLFLNFKAASPYADYPVDIPTVRTVFEQSVCFILMADDKIVGFLLATEGNFHPYLGLTRIAIEMAWWVEPEHRGHGKSLLDAFLAWTEEAKFEYVTMTAIDDTVGHIYERYGFTKNEVAYIKRITN